MEGSKGGRREGWKLREDSHGSAEGVQRMKICVNVCNMSSCLVLLVDSTVAAYLYYQPPWYVNLGRGEIGTHQYSGSEFDFSTHWL